jgi:RNA polymerase sigma-70 factor (ECF subfamily)
MRLVHMGWPRILRSAEVRSSCPEAVDDADWCDIQAALDGDSDAYSRLVRRYQQPIGSYMWRFTGDRGQWEELVQDVFVEAYLTLASYRGRAPLLHWLRRIATRVGYRWWRERARRRAQSPATVRDWDQLPDDPPAASPSESMTPCRKKSIGSKTRWRSC